MAAAPQNLEFDFQSEKTWPHPPQVSHDTTDIFHNRKTKDYIKHQVFHRSRPKSPAEPYLPANSKSSTRIQHKPKYAGWASGGPMQALFLDSGTRSGGTGVFLPSTNFQSSKKPASPVLLPSRVVHALNLNVHALGLQISPRKGSSSSIEDKDDCCNVSVKNKFGGKECCLC